MKLLRILVLPIALPVLIVSWAFIELAEVVIRLLLKATGNERKRTKRK